MTVDRDLLLRLAAGPVSGAELARETGLTRAAMWKRIEALREAGVDIEARPGQGYALAHAPDWLDAKTIRTALPGPLRAGLAGLEVAWSLDSTNSELLRRNTPVRGVDVLLAERQTGGRGRRGRAWASPLAAHVYLSLARQFGGGLARLGGMSLVAGIASDEELRRAGFEGGRLKWPNDLVVVSPDGFRKLGGLLVEGGGEHGGPVRAVVGLGINVRMPETHAAGIDQPWIDLQSLSAETVSRNRIVAALLGALLPAFDRFDAEGLAPFLPRYAVLDALAGREVDVHEGMRTRRGIASGLAEDGALRVRIEGSEQRLYAGDVSVRAK
mgnify:CR=1 FL=1